MPYLQPQSVTSPKDRWHLRGIVYDRGEHNSSIAFGDWDGVPCLTSRWNGSLSNEHTKKGNPISNFQPTWFVLPDFIAQATMKELLMMHATGDSCVNQEFLLQAVNALAPSSNTN